MRGTSVRKSRECLRPEVCCTNVLSLHLPHVTQFLGRSGPQPIGTTGCGGPLSVRASSACARRCAAPTTLAPKAAAPASSTLGSWCLYISTMCLSSGRTWCDDTKIVSPLPSKQKPQRGPGKSFSHMGASPLCLGTCLPACSGFLCLHFIVAEARHSSCAMLSSIVFEGLIHVLALASLAASLASCVTHACKGGCPFISSQIVHILSSTCSTSSSESANKPWPLVQKVNFGASHQCQRCIPTSTPCLQS